MTTWYYRGRPASRSRVFFATLSSSLRRPLPFLLGLLFISLLTTVSRLLVGSLDLGFTFLLTGLLLAYAGLCLLALSALRLLEPTL